MNKEFFKGKRILITQSSLCQLAGSEVTCLELATFFKEQGASVIVFSWFINGSIKSLFSQNKIYTTTDENDPKIKDLDYVWIHHQVLPLILLKNYNKPSFKKPALVFHHMSALDYVYLEQPYIFSLEQKLAAKSVFVSEEALRFNTQKYENAFHSPIVFPNYIPEPFLDQQKSNETLKRILIVSNHPPKELSDSIDVFRKKGYTVNYIGRKSDNYQKVTPDLLKEYDVVISIGKTVQYCLGMNKPVYLYDKHGGCGYLTAKNFDKALFANFSGRGFKNKKSTDIVKEVINGYRSAINYQTKNYQSLVSRFILQDNITKLFKTAKPRTTQLSESYINYAITLESLIKRKIQVEKEKAELKKESQNLEQTIKSQNETIDGLRNTLISMQNSRIVKLANSVHSIPRAISSKIQSFSTQSPEIIAVLCVYNEQLNIDGCLTHLEPYVDKIVIFDDASTDDTVRIAKKHKKVVKIIENIKKNKWDEYNNRKTVLETAFSMSKKKNAWALCVDADERFELNFLKNLKTIAKNHTGSCINIHFRELWDDVEHYRADGVWGKKKKDLFFPLADNMTFNFRQEHHFPWHYQELNHKDIMLDYNLYHLKMIKPKDRKDRVKLYKNLDPEHKMQSIGYDYLTKTDSLELVLISPDKKYDVSTVPDYYKTN